MIAVIREIEDNPESLGEPFSVNNDVITTGICRILNGANGCSIPSNRIKMIAGADRLNDSGDIDAKLADCIVQAAILGEIRYG